MFASSCLRQLQYRCFGRPSRNRRAKAAMLRRRLLPTLEVLEDRTLLSSYIASNPSQLIADINQANANGGQNTITLGATIQLSSVNNYTNGLETISGNGLPVIAVGDQLTILGAGYTIERSTASGTPAFRLFDVASGASLNLQNLTLQGGLAQGIMTTDTAAEGGAVYSAGELTLKNVTVTGNQAEGVNGSQAFSSYGGPESSPINAAGGGLYVAAGSVTLTNDTFSGNYAQGGRGLGGVSGGAYGANGGPGGSATGGAVYVAAGSVTLTNDTLSGNHAQGGTGGPGGTSKGLAGNGGNGGSAAGGGVYAAAGSVTLTNDTLSGNYAQGGSGGQGGNANLSVGNGGNGGNGSNATAGGLYIGNATITLANTLIATNQVMPGAGGAGGAEGSNGALNGAHNGSSGSAGSASDSDISGNVTSSDGDLIGNGSGSNLSNGSNVGIGEIEDLVGTAANPINPQLGPLQNNGGPTQTMALLSGSPAIGAGDPNAPGVPATDQRGYSRIDGINIDIGAFEYGASPASTDLSVSDYAPVGVAAGGQITYTVTVTNNGPSAQSNVTLTDSLSANTTDAGLAMPGGWGGWSATTPFGDGGTVTAWIASLASGASATFTLTVQVNNSTPAGTAISNTASVGPLTGDPNPANNSATVSTLVNPVSDFSFESLALAAGSFQYNPTGSPWTFSGNAGIESNGSAWSAANAPDGTQAAFLQTGTSGAAGQISQTVTLNPGIYSISFWAAQRPGYAVNPIQVQVDGQNVGSPISPTSTSWGQYQTVSFTITSAGSHTIALVSTTPNNGDNDSFIDEVSLSPEPIRDSSFESPALAAGSFQYNPTGSPWTFSGNAGIESNGSAWSAANAPDGTQAAFLQTGTSGAAGQISQTVNLNPGTYYISFWAAQRPGYAVNPIQVQVDGQSVGSPISPTSTSWATYQTPTFTIASAGLHTIAFVSTAPNTADYDSFLDAVSLVDPPPAAQVNLSNHYNKAGIVKDGSTFSGGLENGGNALSANWLGGSNNVVPASGQTIALPLGNYPSLWFLAVGENGNQPNLANIPSPLSVTDKSEYGNTLHAGSGLDWFWATYAGDSLNAKSADLWN